jgi:hypothetical protein
MLKRVGNTVHMTVKPKRGSAKMACSSLRFDSLCIPLIDFRVNCWLFATTVTVWWGGGGNAEVWGGGGE